MSPAPAVSRTSSNVGTVRREWPTDAEHYELLEECGRGVSATVWRSRCLPFNEIVAIKTMDLESVNCSLEEVVKEAQTMRQLHHTNVLALHVSFVQKQQLWMVEPYVAGGSMLNIMKYAYREGLEEAVIATILKEVLKGLEYMHHNGHIHRDVKAGNILIDTDGTVLLADFGVAASLERTGSWGAQAAARNTFVGTPCWMAPEVMEQTQGYNALADIWSFGITILELAHGHAPFARYPPMKVLLMTIQNPPPTLETDAGNKHFSKAMRDIVAKCLVKDPSKRPSAAQLLDHKFFKTAHDPGYLVKHLLHGLPPVQQRVAEMRAGRAPGPATAQSNAEMQESQLAYVQGVSNWNFDVAELKARAALEDHMPALPEQVPYVAEGDMRGSGSPVPAVRSSSSSSALGLPSSGVQAPISAIGLQGAPSAGGTPSKTAPVVAPLAKAISLHKKQGRFEVYEGDVLPLSPPVINGALLMEKGLAKPGTPALDRDAAANYDPPSRSSSNLSSDGLDTQLSQGAAAKRKGRFQIVDVPLDVKARPGRSASMASFGEGTRRATEGSASSPTGPSVSLLLPTLKDVLEGVAGQHERMKELVAAVVDAERGKGASLSALLAEQDKRAASRPLKEDHDRVRSELAQTKEENKRLHERIRVLEEELKRSTASSDLSSHP